MTPQKIFQKALEVAVRHHAGQEDKGGTPYILHVLSVALDDICDDLLTKAVALMHDVFEDTDYQPEDARDDGFPEWFIEAVLSVTKMPDEKHDYMKAIRRAKTNKYGRKVKLADLKNNTRFDRLRPGSITEKDVSRMEKYRLAITELEREENPKQAISN